MLTKTLHRNIYLFGIILLGVSIPFSKFLMSVSQLLLAANWLLELDFKTKWYRLKNNYPALSLIGLYLIHLIWMIGTQDMAYGLKDLRIKLPILILPLIIGSTARLNAKELKLILHFFLVSILASTAVSGAIYLGWTDKEVTNYRDISIFISHIRLSLLTIMGVFIAYHYAKQSGLLYRPFYFLSMTWLVIFLYLLGAYSGLVILLLSIFVLLLRLTIVSTNRQYKIIAFASILVILSVSVWQAVSVYQHFFRFDAVPDVADLETHTINHNPYQHRPSLKVRENGHLVYIYVCPKELEKAWNQHSDIDYLKGLNLKGEPVKLTLYHYLTSLNYRKDSLGFSKLTEQDIKLIEQGCSNHILKNKYSLYSKAYPIIKQVYEYLERGYAKGGTLSQRAEYLKVAKAIIKEHFWWGTGTSNVQLAFDRKYAEGISQLPEQYRLRAHNQFVTFFISFGLIGFLMSIFLMFSPFFKQDYRSFLALVFFVVAYASMLNEDTLETQAGVTFFTFFYVVLLVAKDKTTKFRN